MLISDFLSFGRCSNGYLFWFHFIQTWNKHSQRIEKGNFNSFVLNWIGYVWLRGWLYEKIVPIAGKVLFAEIPVSLMFSYKICLRIICKNSLTWPKLDYFLCQDAATSKAGIQESETIFFPYNHIISARRD